jgi:hypothetical protein
MEQAMAAEGQKLERLIGPKTEHKYEPAERKIIIIKSSGNNDLVQWFCRLAVITEWILGIVAFFSLFLNRFHSGIQPVNS